MQPPEPMTCREEVLEEKLLPGRFGIDTFYRQGESGHATPKRIHVSARVLTQAGAALAGLGLLNAPLAAHAFPLRAGEEVLPWLDQPAENPVPQVVANQLTWEDVDSWITPNEQFFSIAHYNRPVLDANAWQLEIHGLVKHPLTLTLDELKARPRHEVVFTLECYGNHGLPFFWGGIGNARWAGTPPGAATQRGGGARRGQGGGLLRHRCRRRSGARADAAAAFCPQHVPRRRHESQQPALLRDEWCTASATQRVSPAFDC